MKQISILGLLLLFSLASQTSQSQTVFWYESFGLANPCNQGNLAQSFAPTFTNGAWSTTALANSPGNGAQANEWFISATEAGRPIGQCGDGCLNNAGFTNRSLHIGANLAPPLLDPNASYIQSLSSNTNKRVYSSVINCSGKNNITFSFNYLGNGIPGSDDCEVMFYDGSVWQTLGTLAPSSGSCAPMGMWTNTSFPLPASANGNPNLRIGFRWQNSPNANPGNNVSVAIDEITLSSPIVQFSLPVQACPNVTFQPVFTQTPAGVTNFSWTSSPSLLNFNPNPCPAGTLPDITAPVTGTFLVTCYALTNGVLTASSTASVNVVNNVSFTANASSNIVCAGDLFTLSANGGNNYVWQPGNLSGSPVVASQSISTIYTVTGTNANGCPGTGTVNVSMGQAPIISVVSTASAVCPGFTSTLTASGALTYTWTGTGIQGSINQPAIVVWPGTYQVCANNNLPCSTCSIVTIASASPLNVQFTSNPQTATTCIAANFPNPYSQPVQICASGAAVYTWSPASSLSQSIGPCVIARPPVTTCYQVTAATSVCSVSAIYCVTVIPQFSIGVTPSQPILCVGDSMKLVVSNIGAPGLAPFTYNWIEPQNAPPPSINNSLSGTVMISPTNIMSPVVYSVEVLDKRGCASVPRLVTTTVLPQPLTNIALPAPLGVPVNSLCYVGSSANMPSVTLIYTATTVGNPVGDYTYTWVPGYPSPYNAPPYYPIIGSANNNTVMIAAPVRTPAVVVYTLYSGYNGIGYFGATCKRMDTVSVRVVDCRSVTAVSFTTATQNDTICSRTCITFVNFTDTMAGGPLLYDWIFPGGAPQTSTLSNPTICYNLPGVFNVVLKARSPYPMNPMNGGPPGSTVQTGFQSYVKVVDLPNTQISNPPSAINKTVTIRFGQQLEITASNANYYTWDPQYNISTLYGPKVLVSPHKTTEYHVTGYNSSQCSWTDTITIVVIDDCGEMFVPNAFSPNKDGQNDLLYVRGLCLQSMTFMVFNKWGEKVWETDDQKKGWDGTFKGVEENTGVFAWRLEGKTWDGKPFYKNGSTTLLR